MSCEVCAKERGSANVMIPTELGLELKKMCITCATSSGHFCPQHQTQHMLFADNTSACPYCIHEESQALAEKSDFRGMVASALSPEAREQFLSQVPYDLRCPEFERIVSKMVVTAQHRLGIGRQAVVIKLVNEGYHHLIVPPIAFVPAA